MLDFHGRTQKWLVGLFIHNWITNVSLQIKGHNNYYNMLKPDIHDGEKLMLLGVTEWNEK